MNLNKQFATKDAEINYILENKDIIIAQKKNEVHFGDDICLRPKFSSKEDGANKAEATPGADATKLDLELVLNTTNIIDSHLDVHIPGLWNKSLNETKLLFLLQEHSMKFDKIIADSKNDKLTAITKNINWSDLGYNFPGLTEALVFNANISKERNSFMFEQYRKGYVLNHSVGMRYVKIFWCVNREDSDYAQYKENWDKYYPMVVNKEVADKKGYFWAVTEAKLVEGSAVVKGSNEATPTISVTETKIEPSEDTHNGAGPTTPNNKNDFYSFI